MSYYAGASSAHVQSRPAFGVTSARQLRYMPPVGHKAMVPPATEAAASAAAAGLGGTAEPRSELRVSTLMERLHPGGAPAPPPPAHSPPQRTSSAPRAAAAAPSGSSGGSLLRQALERAAPARGTEAQRSTLSFGGQLEGLRKERQPLAAELSANMYSTPRNADWARERLLGAQPEAAAPLEDALDPETRRRRACACAWLAEPAEPPMSSDKVDHIEFTLRQRLGLVLDPSANALTRATREWFAECDPARTGRVLRTPFIKSIGRKLQLDPAAASNALGALFDRYDLEAAGVLPLEAFVAALGSAGAGPTCLRFIGRLRERLGARGGYEELLHASLALRARAAAEHAAAAAAGAPAAPEGCVSREGFLEGVLALARSAELPCSAAEREALVVTFMPPAATGGGAGEGVAEFVSFAELVVAVRGAPMSPERRTLVRRAFEKLRAMSRDGAVQPADLFSHYDVSGHPAVLGGSLSAREAALGFLSPWQVHPEWAQQRITMATFAERYEFVSAAVGDDQHFDAMLRLSWGLGRG